MTLDFDTYFKSLTVRDSYKTNAHDALAVMVANRPDWANLISFNVSKVIYINPQYKEDENGNSFIEFRLERDCDVINDCYLGNEPDKVKSLELIIGDKKIPLERSTLLNMVGSAYTNMIIRATMNTPVNKITFNYTGYLAQTLIRRSFVPRGNDVFKAGNIYYEEFKTSIKL